MLCLITGAMHEETKLVYRVAGPYATIDVKDGDGVVRTKVDTKMLHVIKAHFHSLSLSNCGYTQGHSRILKKNATLHRILMADTLASSDLSRPEVDHIDRNRLNNLLSNLRVVDRETGLRNRVLLGGSSRFPGVRWVEQCGKWRAEIRINGKSCHLGYFVDELDAARRYREEFLALDPKASFEVWKELDEEA